MKPESIHWTLAYAKAGFRAFPVHTIRAGFCSCGGSKLCAPGKHPVPSDCPCRYSRALLSVVEYLFDDAERSQ
jgi:hypothetical protein